MIESVAGGDLPSGLIDALVGLQVEPDTLRHRPSRRAQTPGQPPAVTRYDAVAPGSAGLLVEVARNDEGRRQLACERIGRHWAEAAGVPVPAIEARAADDAWLVGAAARSLAPTAQAVAEALEVADRIVDSPTPPELPDGTSWAGQLGGWERARRGARTIAGGVAPTRFLTARLRYSELTDEASSHGDFGYGNLCRSAEDRLEVVDWEFAGVAPRFTDHVRLWTVLPTRHLRDHAMRLLLAGRGPAECRQIGVVVDWLGIRLLAENLTAPRRLRTRPDLAHARVVAAEAAQLAAALRKS